MTALNNDLIRSALSNHLDPYLKKSFNELNAIEEVNVENGDISVKLALGYPTAGIEKSLSNEIATSLKETFNVNEVAVDIASNVTSLLPQSNALHTLENVRNIIAISSSKGGVGKSTTAVNLALALKEEGARAGILDADIYGPSQPTMLGVDEQTKPEIIDNKYFVPVEAHGIKSMSIGYLLSDDSTLAWRGPMASGALTQMLTQTLWEELDYLLIDLPPGTGDIQLSLSQKVPVSGAVVVTTPQEIAILDTQKGIEMFNKVSVPILGIIENMGLHICTNCGHQEHIFGADGGAKLATKYKTSLLGSLPLLADIRKYSDNGIPVVAAEPGSDIAQIYKDIALNVSSQLWALHFTQPKAPNIVIE